jgi:carbon-monoxide dehydrogenase medium subunit
MLWPFEMHQPKSVGAASKLMGRYGDDGAFYAGGTELLLVMKEGLVRYKHLIDLKTIKALDKITYAAKTRTLHIGGTATHTAVQHHAAVLKHFPLISEVENVVANVRVRNVGTLGGNLCFAEPHADPGTLFLTFDTEVELASSTGTRTVPMTQFFVGPYETLRQPDEVLTRISIKGWGAHTRGAYMKFGYHERPTLGVAAAITLDAAREHVVEARIAVGCVGPAPARIAVAEERLRGVALADVEGPLDDAASVAGDGIDAVSDLHGSAEYKKEMVKVFVRRAFHAARAKFDAEPDRGAKK